MNESVRRLPVSELLPECGQQFASLHVSDVVMDSRQVTEGALFLACRGASKNSGHGLRHVADAIRRGAVLIAWEPAPGIDDVELEVPSIAVKDLSSRVGDMAAQFWGHPSQQLDVVGITGTDGKTSTAYLLAQAWTALGTPTVYIGTLGWGSLAALEPMQNTTPDPATLQRSLAQARDSGAKAAVVEVSSHALAQGRITGTIFAAAVLTNVGRDHLDYHRTIGRYASAKRLLFDRGATRTLIFNRDDAYGVEWALQLAGQHPLMLYGIDGESPATQHVIGRDLSLHADGLTMKLSSSQGSGFITSSLLGRFNAYNLLASASVLVAFGVPLPDACSALSEARSVPGRAEVFRSRGNQPSVVVDYAHTPQALGQILTALKPHVQGRLICVFGCGGERDAGKRPLMGATAAQLADLIILTDDNPRTENPGRIISGIRAGIPDWVPLQVIHDRGDAIRAALSEGGVGDMVVVAGKGHESVQIVGKERHAFSDRDFVKALTGSATGS